MSRASLKRSKRYARFTSEGHSHVISTNSCFSISRSWSDVAPHLCQNCTAYSFSPRSRLLGAEPFGWLLGLILGSQHLESFRTEPKLRIISIWQCFPSDRSATVGLQQKSFRGMPRESDVCSFNEYAAKSMQVPRIRKNSRYASDNLTGYSRNKNQWVMS